MISRIFSLASFAFFGIFFPNLCMSEGPSRAKFPLIIMGGNWELPANGKFSNLSRVCDVGFTHIFSYSTEGAIDGKVEFDSAIRSALAFSDVVSTGCPNLELVVGIPRRWIAEGNLDLISRYVKTLEAKRIRPAFWYSDELMHSMTRTGLSLEDASAKAKNVLLLIKNISNIPYIWVEPGNYNAHFSSILGVLERLPFRIVSFDEYVISRSGRLINSKENFSSLLNTLHRLKMNGDLVFPVIEIGVSDKSKKTPLDYELSTIFYSLALSGSNGLLFYEERWTDDSIFASLRRDIKFFSEVVDFLSPVHRSSNSGIRFWYVQRNSSSVIFFLNESDYIAPLPPTLRIADREFNLEGCEVGLISPFRIFALELDTVSQCTVHVFGGQ